MSSPNCAAALHCDLTNSLLLLYAHNDDDDAEPHEQMGKGERRGHDSVLGRIWHKTQ